MNPELYHTVVKEYFYKGRQVDLKIIEAFKNKNEAVKCLKLYEKFLTHRPDPWFGDVDEAWGKRIRSGICVWIRGGKAIRVIIVPLTIAM